MQRTSWHAFAPRIVTVLLLVFFACACGIAPPKSAEVANPVSNPIAAPSPAPSTSPAAPAPPPSPAPNSSLPTPPANAVVITAIEETSSPWNSCSDCAGGLNVTADYWTAPLQTSPSLDGASREFYVGGPPWTAALFYHKLSTSSGQFNDATHFLWDFWFYVDDTSMQNVWDLEFDLYQAIAGWEYMIGTHCVFGSTDKGQYWEGYSQAEHRWVATTVPCSRKLLPANQWHHIQWMMERIPGTQDYKYDTLVVDGTAYQINMVQTAAPIDWSDVLGVQWQIDTNANGGAVHEWVDKSTVTIW